MVGKSLHSRIHPQATQRDRVYILELTHKQPRGWVYMAELTHKQPKGLEDHSIDKVYMPQLTHKQPKCQVGLIRVYAPAFPHKQPRGWVYMPELTHKQPKGLVDHSTVTDRIYMPKLTHKQPKGQVGLIRVYASNPEAEFTCLNSPTSNPKAW